MHFPVRPLALAASLLGAHLTGGLAHAQSNSTEYLQIPNIAGQSSAIGHNNWIDVNNVTWSISADSSWVKGGGASVSKARPSAVSWTQNIEPSLVKMQQAQLTGKPLTAATFDYVDPRNAKEGPYFTLGLKNGAYTNVAIDGFSANVSAVSSTMSFSYKPQGKGNSGTSTTATWDIQPNQFSGPRTRAPADFVGTTPAASSDGTPKAYLRLDGIAGDSRAKGYENWIELSNASWGFSSAVSLLKSGATIGKPIPSEFTWTQSLDATVLNTVQRIATGTNIPTIVLEYVMDNGAGPATFLQFAVEGAYFTKIAATNTTVTQSVVFKSIQETIWEIKDDGTRGNSASYSYDFPSAMGGLGVHGIAAPSGYGKGNLSPVAISPVTNVPEPESWAMMLAGLALVSTVARRRK